MSRSIILAVGSLNAWESSQTCPNMPQKVTNLSQWTHESTFFFGIGCKWFDIVFIPLGSWLKLIHPIWHCPIWFVPGHYHHFLARCHLKRSTLRQWQAWPARIVSVQGRDQRPRVSVGSVEMDLDAWVGDWAWWQKEQLNCKQSNKHKWNIITS